MTPKARAVALTLGVFVAACCGVTAEGRAPTVYKPSEASFAPVAVFTPTPAPTLPPRAVAGPLTTPKPSPKPRGRISTALIGGKATWYAAWYMNKGDRVGAAGPALRVGKWRGRTVKVCSSGECVKVKLVDWCACGRRNGVETLIDLSPSAFAALAPINQGVIRVTVEW